MITGDTALNEGLGLHGSQGGDAHKMHFPKMMLVAGDGRNVGKTYFASQIIRKFARETSVIAIKTTPHRHVLTSDLEVLVETDHYVVALEHGSNQKDTGQFLKAGAENVYFIAAAQEYAGTAITHIATALAGHIVVAESGSLIEHLRPGIFFFVVNHENEITRKQYLVHQPVLVKNIDGKFDFDIEKLCLKNNECLIND